MDFVYVAVNHAYLRGSQAQEESAAAKAAMAKSELEKNSAIQIKESTEWKCKEVWSGLYGCARSAKP